VIRVGDDYYFITSTFQYSPSMAVLHSKDLVNWQYLGDCMAENRRAGKFLKQIRRQPFHHLLAIALGFYPSGMFFLLSEAILHARNPKRKSPGAGRWWTGSRRTNPRGVRRHA